MDHSLQILVLFVHLSIWDHFYQVVKFLPLYRTPDEILLTGRCSSVVILLTLFTLLGLSSLFDRYVSVVAHQTVIHDRSVQG